jgi:hypothetical protein
MARHWWLVRGEQGSLFPSLFLPKGVVAIGSKVRPHDLGSASEARERALEALNSRQRDDVDLFDRIVEGDAIVTPDAGTRQAWFGVCRSERPFADTSAEHWIQRRCEWHPTAILLSEDARTVLLKGNAGTVWEVTSQRAKIVACLDRA